MIHRKFEKRKFSRTYIGGSKKTELKMFLDAQGTKEDNSECNWLEYRRLLMEYCNDILNVIVSWVDALKKLRIIFAVIAVLVSVASLAVGMIFLVLAVTSHAIHWHLKCLELKRLSEYNFSLDTINRETGLALSKN